MNANRIIATTIVLAVALLDRGALIAAPSYNLLHDAWPAQWIDVPGTAPQGYGVYHFRRTFQLVSKPERFMIHVSGDNRYQLFANGRRVSWGPARGDLTHWRYETVDIASALVPGKNVLAAVVWNDGEFRAVAQVTNRTGFVLQADRPENAVVNTDASWKCTQDQAYSPQPIAADQVTGYHALAADEKLDGSVYPWGWEQIDFDDSAWLSARSLSAAAGRDSRDAPNRWMLVESRIPLEEQSRERLHRLRKIEGATAPSGFPERASAVTIPAHTNAVLLLDQTYLTTAYPNVIVSRGSAASITLRYAETLYIQKDSKAGPQDKGNRNDIEGKRFYGYSDTYMADGGMHRPYRPLFWRTYRYMKLDVKTSSEPLTIEDIYGDFSAYPFEKKATFEFANDASDGEIQKILSTGWRTARLCAHETYMDCPYYEQLQYAGDARIQMMVSLYMTGDARLMKNGISLLNDSRTAEGATYSRAPSYLQQYIPPFSLWWIGMVHDYWMYVDDPAFVREMLPGVRAVLSFYGRYQKENATLTKMPWWNFVDWVKQWPTGEPPADPDGSSSAALDLQLLLAYQWVADLEEAFGTDARAAEYTVAANKLEAAILSLDWDSKQGLFADQPSHRTFSQQVNTLAVLAHVVAGQQARSIVKKMLSDPSLAQSSIYFRAYTNATLRQTGLGNRYLDQLGPWREMLSQGLTTWAEWSGPDARSDCHAWGASPNIELLRTIAGISSAAPGFGRVRIAPNLGQLEHIKASMPHPKGMIRVNLEQRKGTLNADIQLPGDVPGDLVWGIRTFPLKGGKNHLNRLESGGTEAPPSDPDAIRSN